jgi:hypothetical protein
MRIAMWSGPRNLSTAMMYAFAQRADCAVVDEPFYGAYLRATGVSHPMGDAIMAAMEADAHRVAEANIGPIPGGKDHYYQKHMTHHMIDGCPLDWMADVANVFLIRHPARVIASYTAKRESPVLEDLGFTQQLELFERACALGQDPVVVDGADIRANPEGMLQALCDAVGMSFDPAMLSWPAGGNAADGVWAAHWYGAVHRSTGFAGAEGPVPDVAPEMQAIFAPAMACYDAMVGRKLRV